MGRLAAARVKSAEESAGAFVPYSHHVTPEIVATRNGEYLSVWHLGGRSHSTAAAEDLRQWVSDLNNAVRTAVAAAENVTFWSHVLRRRVEDYPQARFDNHFCRRLDERYGASLRECSFLVNELYLTVVVRTIGDDVLEALGRFENASQAEKDGRQVAGTKRLDEINRVLRTALRRYDAELLTVYEREGHVFSRPLEFLAQLVNGERLPMPVCRGRFGDFMVQTRPFFSWHGEVGELRLAAARRRFGMMEVVEYDGAGTAPGDLGALLSSRFEFVLSQSFSVLSKYAAKGFLERHKARLEDAQDVAKSQVKEIDVALDQLMSGEFILGEHHATLLAFGDEVDEVQGCLAWARAELADRGLVAKPLDLALEAAFWAQLPGNWSLRPRPCAITSQNFLCLSPFHNTMSGKPAGNPWGPAVTVLRTASGAPLYFSFHASPPGNHEGQRLLGNTVVLGQSSAGKTVLLGFLLAQAQKFGPRVVVIDKDRGLEIAVRAMGGRYFPLKAGEPTGWNPLQLAPEPGNVLFMKELVTKLVATSGEPLTAAEDRALEEAVRGLVTHIEWRDRRLSTLAQFCEEALAMRLARWCEGGQYGWVFDNTMDRLDLSTHRMYGFDVTEFLGNPTVCGPMMEYLVFRTEGMLNAGRFIYVFDEWWKALSNDGLARLSKDKGKTIRKQDGLLLLCTQEPNDALRSPEGRASIQQCATMILLRNPGADRSDYIDGLKLTEREYEIVRTLPEDSRRFLVKQGDFSTVAELDLDALQAELKVLSGTPDRAALVEQLVAEHGEKPEAWLPLFWERLGVTA